MTRESSEVPSRLGAAVDVLSVAAAIGLATGLVHGIALFASQRFFGAITFQSRDFVWMAPLSYAALFIGMALLPAVGAFLRPRVGMLRAALGVFAFLGMFGLLLPITQISKFASCILALGIAVQLVRSLKSAPQLVGRRARIAAVTLLGIVGVTGAFGEWRTRSLRAHALANLPASDAGAPNVLLLILDTVRASSLSLYGSQLATTPLLDRWAQQGVTFDWAMSTAPWTLPSHASMFTGHYPLETGTDWTRPLSDSLPVLAEIFRDRGYVTIGVVANQDYAAWDSGLARGFIQYDDFVRGPAELRLSNAWMQTEFLGRLWGARQVAQVANAFREFDLDLEVTRMNRPRRADMVVDQFLDVQRQHSDRPFFAFLNFFDAHAPYYAPPDLQVLDADHPTRTDYHNAIRWLDFTLDRLFNELNDRGVLDNTVVVVTSDHGEMIDERGFTGHAYYLYEHLLHVPLVVRFPRSVPAKTRVERAVSLRDLPATILELAGVADGRIPGKSLAAAWRDSIAELSPVFAEVARVPNIAPRFPTSRGPMDAVFDDSLHLIRGPGDSTEVYRYRPDSLEVAPIARSDSASGPRRARLQQLIESMRRVPGTR